MSGVDQPYIKPSDSVRRYLELLDAISEDTSEATHAELDRLWQVMSPGDRAAVAERSAVPRPCEDGAA